ncbi:MAG: arginine repressor [Ignavibacteriae bacterium]|nr:arginine repressor [Ignavibacteriota bacterium]
MNKSSRHLAIKQIIAQRPIASQEELCDALGKAGFEVTQATLSRDLKELGIARINAPEGPRYVLHHQSEERRLQSVISYEVERIDANEVMVIIRTLPGRAPGVASFIDSLQHRDILGTLAGDDTVLVTPSSTKKIRNVLQYIKDALIARAA